jgi:hypothetical protein
MQHSLRASISVHDNAACYQEGDVGMSDLEFESR